MAIRAVRLQEELRVLLAGILAGRFAPPTLQLGDRTLEFRCPRARAVLALPTDLDAIRGAVQDDFAMGLGQIAPRHVEIDAELLGHALENPPQPAGVHAVRPDRHRPVAQGLALVGHDGLRRDLHGESQALAVRTRAQRRVEREHQRRQFGEAAVAGVAVQRFREGFFAPRQAFAHRLHDDLALALLQRRLDAVGQARALVLPNNGAIHHQIDVVLLLLVQRETRRQVDHRAVHPRPREALRQCIRKHLGERALALPFERRQDENARTFR